MTGERSVPEVPTVASRIAAWASDVEHLLPDLASGTLHDWTMGSSGGVVFVTGSPFAWSDLSTPHTQTQSRALEEYRRLLDLLRVLLRGQPRKRLDELEEDAARVLVLIERQHSSFPTPSQALENARAALRRQVAHIGHLFSADEGTLLVPDTNALYWNPAVEDWRSPWPGRFSLVLTPPVLAEIDRHKDDARNSARQAKAERLARQIGEYRRRGRLVDGVPLVRDVSTIVAIATEPNLSDSLPWLDPSSIDDRVLASGIEVMRRNVRARVILVTRDLNLQNKLEFARVPFLTPSDVVNRADEKGKTS